MFHEIIVGFLFGVNMILLKIFLNENIYDQFLLFPIIGINSAVTAIYTQYLLSKRDASLLMSMITAFSNIFVIALAIFFLNEQLSQTQWFGFFIIISGLFFLGRKSSLKMVRKSS